MRIKYPSILVIILLVLSTTLGFDAFSTYINPYFTASQLMRNSLAYLNGNIQVIETVVNGYTSRREDDTSLLDLTDPESTITITYKRSLPQNFKEAEQARCDGETRSPKNYGGFTDLD